MRAPSCSKNTLFECAMASGRFMYLRRPAPGMAGSGGTHSAANKIEILVFPNCFTVPTFLTEAHRESLGQPLECPTPNHAGAEFLPQAAFSVNKHSQKLFVVATGRQPRALPLELSLHPA